MKKVRDVIPVPAWVPTEIREAELGDFIFTKTHKRLLEDERMKVVWKEFDNLKGYKRNGILYFFGAIPYLVNAGQYLIKRKAAERLKEKFCNQLDELRPTIENLDGLGGFAGEEGFELLNRINGASSAIIDINLKEDISSAIFGEGLKHIGDFRNWKSKAALEQYTIRGISKLFIEYFDFPRDRLVGITADVLLNLKTKRTDGETARRVEKIRKRCR